MNSMPTFYKESIDVIYALLNLIIIKEVVNIIYESKRIFMYSIGDMCLTVKSFIDKLIKLNYYPILATDMHEEIANSKNIKENDCAIFVTYRAEAKIYIECLKIIKKSGCKIIFITANKDSVLNKFCNYTILLPDKEKSDRITTYFSQLALTYIFSVFYALLFKKEKQSN